MEFAVVRGGKNALAIAGRTTNCKALNPGACTNEIGAFIMHYDDMVQTAPSKLLVMSHVTTAGGDQIAVIGVLAIRVWPNDDGIAGSVSVLETVDKTLVVSINFTVKSFIYTYDSQRMKICNFHQSNLYASKP